MDSNESDAPNSTSAEGKQKDKSKVAEYLQAPRRKRKSYVVMALGSGTQDYAPGLDAFLRTTFKGLAIALPRTLEELTKMFGRQIVLLIYDDEFAEMEAALNLIGALKQKRSAAALPVLFLTRQPDRLIESYNKTLSVFQETDDYFVYSRGEAPHLYSKVRQGLLSSYRRRSRRYKVDIDLEYYLLSDDSERTGRLLDLSLHGALLEARNDRIFRLGEQVKLRLPIAAYLTPTTGEFLKLSGRVRRVFIGGTRAGISFEHVSDSQLLTLTKLLTEMVNDQVLRSALTRRNRAERA